MNQNLPVVVKPDYMLQRDRKGMDFLVDGLKDGPVLVSALRANAKSQGITWGSVRLARYSLGLVSYPSWDGQMWKLPKHALHLVTPAKMESTAVG